MTTRPGYIWSGTEWVSIGQEAVVAPVSYQTSAPSTPSTGDIWIDSNDDVPGIDTSQFLRWRKTAAGSETSLSGTDDTGLTLAYTANYEQVYLNGVLLVRGQDYTATNGTSITGLTALAANDVVEVFGVVARVVGDVYTQAQTNSLLDAKSNVSSTGLVLLSSTTIPASTSTLTITNAFSSAYINYKVVISGTTQSAANDISIRLGSTTTGYYYSLVYGNWGTSVAAIGGTASGFLYLGSSFGSNGQTVDIDIFSPFLSTYSSFRSTRMNTSYTGLSTGYLANTTSYTDFTVLPDSSTLTGGTIKVYGYK